VNFAIFWLTYKNVFPADIINNSEGVPDCTISHWADKIQRRQVSKQPLTISDDHGIRKLYDVDTFTSGRLRLSFVASISSLNNKPLLSLGRPRGICCFRIVELLGCDLSSIKLFLAFFFPYLNENVDPFGRPAGL
jgi:hypothetical protein